MSHRKKVLAIITILTNAIVFSAIFCSSCSQAYTNKAIEDMLYGAFGVRRGSPKLNPLVGKHVVLIGKAVSHQKQFAWIEIDKRTLVQVSNEAKWSNEFEGRQVKVSGTLEIFHIPSVPPEDTWPRYFIEDAKWELVPVTRSSK